MDMIIPGIIAGFFGLILASIALVQELLIRRIKGKEPTLQDRISELTKNLEASVAVITEIEEEISKRKNLASQLEEDIERYNVLKGVSETQLEAIAQTLNIPIKRESHKSFIYNFVSNLLIAGAFFAIGYFIGGK